MWRKEEEKGDMLNLNLVSVMTAVWTLVLLPFQVWLWLAMIPFRVLGFLLSSSAAFIPQVPEKEKIEEKHEEEKHEEEPLQKKQQQKGKHPLERGPTWIPLEQAKTREEALKWIPFGHAKHAKKEEAARAWVPMEEATRTAYQQIPLEEFVNTQLYIGLQPESKAFLEETISSPIFKGQRSYVQKVAEELMGEKKFQFEKPFRRGELSELSTNELERKIESLAKQSEELVRSSGDSHIARVEMQAKDLLLQLQKEKEENKGKIHTETLATISKKYETLQNEFKNLLLKEKQTKLFTEEYSWSCSCDKELSNTTVAAI